MNTLKGLDLVGRALIAAHGISALELELTLDALGIQWVSFYYEAGTLEISQGDGTRIVARKSHTEIH